MAILTNSLVSALRIGFARDFQNALSKAQSQWELVSTRVPSTNVSNTYGWLGQYPKLREWTGDRVFKDIKEHGYTVTNKKYEATVAVDRAAIEDDNIGIYSPLFSEMGYAAATHPDEIIFSLLANGHLNDCFDAKKFFAADHPVYPNADGSGVAKNVSNLLSPTTNPKAAWYLLDVSRPLKPFIFQERTKPELQVITSPENDTVFMKDSIPYGIRYRCNGGYGFWQQAVKSTYELETTSFELALLTMREFKSDGGRPLGLGRGGKDGLVLVVPSSLLAEAKNIVEAQNLTNGASNIWYNSATVIDCPWLD